MIPSLPTEIIRQIILFSLPSVKQTTYRERYNLLLACSLVNSIWKEIAQDELLKHIVVNGGYLLYNELARRKGLGLDLNVVSLELKLSKDVKCGEWIRIKLVLELCYNVQELWLIDFDMSIFDDKVFFDWSTLIQLRSLHLIRPRDDIELDDTFAFNSLQFLNLTHLTIFNSPSFVEDYEPSNGFKKFIQNSSFPSLTSLVYSTIEIEPDLEGMMNSTFDIDSIPQSILSQLKHLVVFEHSSSFFSSSGSQKCLEMLQSLETLIISNSYLFETEFQPSPLLNYIELLHFGYQYNYEEQMNILKDWLERNDDIQQTKQVVFHSPIQQETYTHDRNYRMSKERAIKNFEADQKVEADMIKFLERQCLDYINYKNPFYPWDWESLLDYVLR